MGSAQRLAKCAKLAKVPEGGVVVAGITIVEYLDTEGAVNWSYRVHNPDATQATYAALLLKVLFDVMSWSEEDEND